jgi:hypothetical protein
VIVIRASYLSSYVDCPRRTAARIFAQDITAAGFNLRQVVQGIGAAIGTAVHKGAATILREKANLGRMPPPTLGFDAARDELRLLASEGIVYDDISHKLPEAETATLRMVASYRDELAPWIDPILVEERLEAKAGAGLMLSGQSDVIAREPGTVRDLKSGKGLGYHKPQLGGYSLLARARGLDIQRAVIDFVQRVSHRQEQPPPVSIEYDVDKAESVALNILRVMDNDIRTFRDGSVRREIAPGDPAAFMANPNSRLCSANWCAAWGTRFCVEHRGAENERD